MISLLLITILMLLPFAAHSRPINPNKDILQYGYGSVAWRNQFDGWKRRQFEKMQDDPPGDEKDNPDLPM